MNSVDDNLFSDALHAADAAAPLPLQPGLADRVRTRARRQRRNRQIAAGSLALSIVAVGLTLTLLRRDRGTLPPPVVAQQKVGPITSDRLGDDVILASREADVRLAVARRLVTAERQRRVARLAESLPTAADPVAAHREQAALTLVDYAERLQGRVVRPIDALATYRRAIELFPETPAADVARRRIEQLQSHGRT